MKIYIQTVTPVHIGTGKMLTKFDYVGSNRIDFFKFVSCISPEQQEQVDKLTEVANFEELSLDRILSALKIDRKYVTENCSLYRLPRDFKPETREAVKAGDSNLYIPGSSIKGMIRTALLYKSLKNSSDFQVIVRKILSDLQNPRDRKAIDRIKKRMDDTLEYEAFYCGIEKNTNNAQKQISYSDQKYDLLKLLRITDTNNLSTSEFCDVSQICLYALNKKEEHKKFHIHAESIIASATFEFDLSIDLQFLKKARDLIKKNDKSFSKRDWISITEKVKNLYDLDLASNVEITEESIVSSVLDSVYEFGQQSSLLESRWYEKFGAKRPNLKRIYETDKISKLGFSSGFGSMTILPLLLQSATNKDYAKKIYDKVGIGKHRNGAVLDIDLFPFTLKFIKEGEELIPMGWCQLSMQEFSDSVIDRSTISGKIDSEDNTLQNQKKRIESSWIEAVVIDITAKPLRVKMLSGKFEGQETILPVGNPFNLGISLGSKVYVELSLDKKKKLVKAEYRGNV